MRGIPYDTPAAHKRRIPELERGIGLHILSHPAGSASELNDFRRNAHAISDKEVRSMTEEPNHLPEQSGDQSAQRLYDLGAALVESQRAACTA